MGEKKGLVVLSNEYSFINLKTYLKLKEHGKAFLFS